MASRKYLISQFACPASVREVRFSEVYAMQENPTNAPTDKTVNCDTLQLAEVPIVGQEVSSNSSKSLGHYQIKREIGRGAMGTVYEAVHDQLHRTVALKILPAELAESPKRLQRFQREMAAIGRLEHPNIVLATDAGQADGLCYIAMQYIDGPDVEAVMNQIGRFDPADACEIIRQAALGLQHIHEQRLVHRDIKPSNIVLTRRGEVKILDLGIAMLRNVGDRETAMTAAGQLMGTPDYIAPEQIGTCYDVDIRADIYSLGCTLYSLLSGSPPFAGPGYTTFTAKLLGHAERDPEPLGERCPEVPPPIVDLVERMMSKNREDRPASPSDVAAEIEQFCKDADLVPIASGQRRAKAPVANRTDSTNKEGTTNKHRSPKVVWAAGGGTIAALFGLVLLIATPSAPEVEMRFATPIAVTEPHQAQINVAVNRIAESNQSIANSTAAIAKTVDQVRSEFQQSQQRDTTILDPKSPADHYFNARVYAQRGDQRKARNSFLAYFADELGVVDPHLQFCNFLKLQEGIAGAREMYLELPGDTDLPARRLAIALLHPEKHRIVHLERLIQQEPGFAPAWYELSRMYSAVQTPRRTLTAMKRERELLTEFVRLNENGKLLEHYLDQSLVPPMLADAETRLNLIRDYASAYGVDSLDAPVKLKSAIKNGSYWHVDLLIAEPTIDVQYRIQNHDEFRSTGTNNVFVGGNEMTDPNTGMPFPRMYFQLDGDTPACEIEVQYYDADEKVQGPYVLQFDPVHLLAAHQRAALEMEKPAWVVLSGDRLMFALFQRHRSLIKSVVYGIDQETPTLSMPVPKETGELSWGDYVIPAPKDAKFATIQVTYLDGTKSEIVKLFRFQ
jgi:serine/threonine protein kinase